MYDCFNMAYQDSANALQLHIKVNSENLLPVAQKYNAGSLRIPADPSWPKIPQRKLASDIDDTIESPCVITLTGTPRKSRTMVRTPVNQSPKSLTTKDSAYSSFCHQRTTSSMHTLKRFPGYVDPRFKKVTNVKKNQVTANEFLEKKGKQFDISTSTEHLYNKELEKSIPERDSNMDQVKMQETEKSHETGRTELPQAFHDSEPDIKTNEYVKGYQENNIFDSNQQATLQQHCTNNVELKHQENISETIKEDKYIKSFSEHTLKSTVNDTNTQENITSLPVQENNGQLFFVLDKKLKSHPLNTIHLDTINIPQEHVKQYYNVQVPVLTYQNIPMQMSTSGTSNIMQQCLNNPEPNMNMSLIKKRPEPPSHSTNTDLSNQFVQTTLDNNTKKEDIHDSKRKIILIQSTTLAENTNNYFEPNIENSNIPEKLQNTNIQQKKQESSDSEYYIPNIHKRNKHNNALKIKNNLCNTSGEETTDSELTSGKNIQKRNFLNDDMLATKATEMNIYSVQGDVKPSVQNQNQVNSVSKKTEHFKSMPQSNTIITDQTQPSKNEYNKTIHETKTRNKSEQNLPCAKNERSRKLGRNSEPHITFKQKKVPGKFSRKAKSYFQKNSHSALVDSDYTLMWPNCQHSRHKRSQTNTYKLNNHKTKKIEQQVTNSSNFAEYKYIQNNENINPNNKRTKSLSKTCLQKEYCKCEASPRSNTDDTVERPKGISPKTQELLNKSYWEFYNKLRHKIKDTDNIEQEYSYQLTMDALETVKKENMSETYSKELWSQLKLNPELQTLQQCSALSSMINKALDTNIQPDIMQTKQLYINDNMKLSSNIAGGMQNVNIKTVVSNLNNNKPMLNDTGYKTNNMNDKQVLELKSIIFFGGMMYILIIFFPMLYDYFYHEEYDDYENLSYLELIVEYILSSFKEAFGDVFNGVKQFFFYLHACKKCTNIS